MYKSKFVYKNRLRQKEPNGYTKEIISYEQLSKTLVFFLTIKFFKKLFYITNPLSYPSYPTPSQNKIAQLINIASIRHWQTSLYFILRYN